MTGTTTLVSKQGLEVTLFSGGGELGILAGVLEESRRRTLSDGDVSPRLHSPLPASIRCTVSKESREFIKYI